MKGFIELSFFNTFGEESKKALALSAIISIITSNDRTVITTIEKQKDGTNISFYVKQSYDEVLMLIQGAS
jgi:hypothetical protein